MEDIKLLKVIIVLTSFLFLANCSSTGVRTVTETHGQFAELPFPSTLGEKQFSAPGMMWNGVQYLRFNLNKAEKLQHQQAVFHALNNADIGEITGWYSKKRLANGKVRVVFEYPTSDGYCRTYQSYILLNGAQRHMTNKACKRLTQGWVFLK